METAAAARASDLAQACAHAKRVRKDLVNRGGKRIKGRACLRDHQPTQGLHHLAPHLQPGGGEAATRELANTAGRGAHTRRRTAASTARMQQ